MESISLTDLADRQLAHARDASSGRSSETVRGGHHHHLRQTLIAVTADHDLDEHESPGEASLQVLRGRVRLEFPEESKECAAGDYVVLPEARHSVSALEDSVMLLTVVTPRHLLDLPSSGTPHSDDPAEGAPF